MQRATSPIQNKKVPVRKSNLPGLLAFDTDNLFPQKLLSVVSDSVTATACISAKAEFIEGNGFLDTALSKLIVHRSGLTGDAMLNQTAWNVSFGEVITWLIGYNGNGLIDSIRPVPFEFVRLALPDAARTITHGAVCPYLDNTLEPSKKQHFTKLPLYNSDRDTVLNEIELAGGIKNYYGQLLYEPFWSPGDSYYHTPSWFSGIRAIESEGQLDNYDWNTIRSGFNISGILKVMNPAAVTVPGPNGTTDTVAYNPYNDPNSIENQIADHQGPDNAASVLIARFDSVDEMNTVQFIDTTGADLSDRYKSTSERVEARIMRAFRVPNELVGIRRVGGISPTGDEIKVASQLMQQTVNRYQRKVSQVLSEVLRHWKEPVILDPENPCSIQNLNYFPEQTTSTNGNSNRVAQPG